MIIPKTINLSNIRHKYMKNGNIKFIYIMDSITIIGIPVLYKGCKSDINNLNRILDYIVKKFKVENSNIQTLLGKKENICICISGIYVNKAKKNIGLIFK
jgi:hypothetical protein